MTMFDNSHRVQVPNFGTGTYGTTGFVYFARACGLSLIKIGFSTNWRQRLKKLNGEAPTPISFLLVARASHAVEQALHKKFAAHRKHGEWFSEDAILAWLCCLEAGDESSTWDWLSQTVVHDELSHTFNTRRALSVPMEALYIVDGMTIAQIAKHTSQPQETVRRRLLKAGVKLHAPGRRKATPPPPPARLDISYGS